VAEQFQTEIPRRPIVRKFRVPIGHCTGCGRRVQGRHDLQTSDALGATASQVGPVGHRRPRRCCTPRRGPVARQSDGRLRRPVRHRPDARGQRPDRLAGRDAARSGLPPSSSTTCATPSRSRPTRRVGASEGNPPGSTRGSVTGADAYGIDSQRSAAVLERVIGVDWDGILSHDGFASYQRFTEAVHQQCTGHVLRRARELLETATRGAVRFPRQVIVLFTEAVHERKRFLRGEMALEELQGRGAAGRVRRAFAGLGTSVSGRAGVRALSEAFVES
jgi:transposase